MNVGDRGKRSEHAQSMVEFSIGIVVLLTMLVGIFDGARALYAYLSMRDAAQEGAVFASLNPTQPDAVEVRVHESSNFMMSLNAAISVTTTPTNAGKFCMGSVSGHANRITVTINYPEFPLTMPMIGAFIGSQTVPIRAAVTETILQPKCP